MGTKTIAMLFMMALGLMGAGIPVFGNEKGTTVAQKISEAWEKLTPEIEVDRTTTVAIAGEEVKKIKLYTDVLRTEAAKQMAFPAPKEEWRETLAALEEKTDEVEGRYKTLKNAKEVDWVRSQRDFRNSTQAMYAQLEEAYARYLPDKTGFEWKAQRAIDQGGFKIKKMESKLKGAAAEEQASLSDRLRDLKAQRDQLTANLSMIKGEISDAWRSMKPGTEDLMRSMD